MTGPDLIRLAEELARSGGVHRLTSLVTAAVHVCLEHERRGRTVEAWEDGPCGVGLSDKVVLQGALCPGCNQPGYCRQHSICHYTGSPMDGPPQAPSRPPAAAEPSGRAAEAQDGRGASTGTGDGLNEVTLEPGWMERQFKAAQELLDHLPPALREQTPARRNARALDKCDEHDFRRSNPAPIAPEPGERRPLPRNLNQEEGPRGEVEAIQAVSCHVGAKSAGSGPSQASIRTGNALSDEERAARLRALSMARAAERETRGVTHGPGSKIAREFGRPIDPAAEEGDLA